MELLTRLLHALDRRIMDHLLNREAAAMDRTLVVLGYRYAVRKFGVQTDGAGGYYIVDRDSPPARTVVLASFPGDEARALRVAIRTNYYWHVVGHRPPLSTEF